MPLDAEGTAAATSALHVRVVKFEARAFDGLDVVDLNAFEVHFAHLIDENFQAFKFIDVVAVLVDLILESHVVTEARAASANHGYAQASRCRSLLLKNLFNLCNRHWCKLNHSPSLHRFRMNKPCVTIPQTLYQIQRAGEWIPGYVCLRG